EADYRGDAHLLSRQPRRAARVGARLRPLARVRAAQARLREMERGRMRYTVKEIFYSLQGEGANVGRPAVFCRFAGCNLWSGHEQDRGTAVCQFCDTDFVGTDGTLGGKFDNEEALADGIVRADPADRTGPRFVVLTGGEPLLQVDISLIRSLHD